MDLVVGVQSGVVEGDIAGNRLNGIATLPLGATDDRLDLSGVDRGAGQALATAKVGREISTTLLKTLDATACLGLAMEESGGLGGRKERCGEDEEGEGEGRTRLGTHFGKERGVERGREEVAEVCSKLERKARAQVV